MTKSNWWEHFSMHPHQLFAWNIFAIFFALKIGPDFSICEGYTISLLPCQRQPVPIYTPGGRKEQILAKCLAQGHISSLRP